MFVAIAALGLLAIAGLAVDGGAKVRAAQRADRVAAEAGRAALQAVDLDVAMTGNARRVDLRPARAAALQHLAAAGLSGTVEVDPRGATLTVTTRASEPAVFLSIVGVHELMVHGRASVAMIDTDGGTR